MKQPVRAIRRLYTTDFLDVLSCLSCQRRLFSTSHSRHALAQNKPNSEIETKAEIKPSLAKDAARYTGSVLEEAPRSHGKAVDKFDPKPLNRPIGIAQPPRAGDNSGIDTRTRREKFNDWKNVEKNRETRREITTKLSTPYFREWSNMRHHDGKSFLCPPRLFKSIHALYFPNMVGQTLQPLESKRNASPPSTTPVLQGKISIVSIFCGLWAENQCKTFTSLTENPALQHLLSQNSDKLQEVKINVEENSVKAWIQDMCRPWIRKSIPKSDWGRYFILRKLLNTELRDAIGMLNSKVGYVYLIDENCRIRWAGSGNAELGETEALVKGVRFLVDETRKNPIAEGGVAKDVHKEHI